MIDSIMQFLAKLLKWEPIASTDNSVLEVPLIAVPSESTPEPSPLSVPVETTPTGANRSHLEVFCTAIRDYEGKPGNLNYKNNNPGNVRCSPVGYAPMYGNVRCVNNFSVFPTYELGWTYLQNLVHFRIHQHPDWTFLDFFNNYAPTADKNDPHAYATNVAKKCGVPVTSKISAFLG